MKRIASELGTFVQESTSMRATDPCYDRDVWCQHLIQNVKPGEWYAYTVVSDEGLWGKRIAELVVVWEGADTDHLIELPDMECGVDSGQLGFFDDQYYQDGASLPDELKACPYDGLPFETSKEIFYSICCAITSKSSRSGMLPHGAVCSSGFGDGVYQVTPFEGRDGTLQKVRAVFIEEDEEE